MWSIQTVSLQTYSPLKGQFLTVLQCLIVVISQRSISVLFYLNVVVQSEISREMSPITLSQYIVALRSPPLIFPVSWLEAPIRNLRKVGYLYIMHMCTFILLFNINIFYDAFICENDIHVCYSRHCTHTTSKRRWI
jgi:hypothetical protein